MQTRRQPRSHRIARIVRPEANVARVGATGITVVKIVAKVVVNARLPKVEPMQQKVRTTRHLRSKWL